MKNHSKQIKNFFSATLLLFFSILIQPLSAKAAAFSNLSKDLKWLMGTDKKSPTDLGLGDIQSVVSRAFDYALDIAGVIALILILYSAFIYATAFGDESKSESAKKALTWSIIGIVVVTFSKVIIKFINTSLK